MYLENVERSHVRLNSFPARKRVPIFCKSDRVTVGYGIIITPDELNVRKKLSEFGNCRVANNTRRRLAWKRNLRDEAFVVVVEALLRLGARTCNGSLESTRGDLEIYN